MSTLKARRRLSGDLPQVEGMRDPSGSSTATSLVRELISLAIPIMGSNIVGLIDGSINAMWVGRFIGETALAAASNGNTVLIFLFAMALGIWTALTIQVGFYLGTDNSRDARRLIRAACAVFVIIGVSVTGAGEILSHRLLRALDVPRESYEQAEQYLRVILFCVPINYLYGMTVAILRGAGDTKTAFYFSVLSVGLDVGLNPILIFGVGPIPGLGIRGAALATVLSQGSGFAALLLFLIRERHFLCPSMHQFTMSRAEWVIAGELLRRGGAMGMEFMGESLLAILLISLVNRFGPNVTAAFGAANQLWNWVMMPSLAVSLAATSIAANCLGARHWERVRTITRFGVTFSLLSAGALVLVLEGFNRRSFELFLPARSPALAIAGDINRIASWSCIAFAGCGALMGTPRAAGAIWGPFTVSAAALVIRFTLAKVLLHYWQVQGVWWSLVISGVISMTCSVLYYQRGSWRSAQFMTLPAASPRRHCNRENRSAL